MEALSHRRAEVLDMGPVPGHVGRTRMSLTCPSRLVTLKSNSALPEPYIIFNMSRAYNYV